MQTHTERHISIQEVNEELQRITIGQNDKANKPVNSSERLLQKGGIVGSVPLHNSYLFDGKSYSYQMQILVCIPVIQINCRHCSCSNREKRDPSSFRCTCAFIFDGVERCFWECYHSEVSLLNSLLQVDFIVWASPFFSMVHEVGRKTSVF